MHFSWYANDVKFKQIFKYTLTRFRFGVSEKGRETEAQRQSGVAGKGRGGVDW